ncbi:cysteine-rich CWC family protein [Polaromonas sp. DSR2-3-2]|uniref:cysteine-rich CWC family protein n=1 Tax=unclassified Polaromonas TaxID=2638319 RepID=UPI003CF3540D
MASTEQKPDTSICPRCGAGLRCGMVAGDAECWCVQLPHVMPVPFPLPFWGKAGVGAGTGSNTSESPHPNPPPEGEGIDPAAATSCFCPACLKQITDERPHPLSPARD